MHLVGTFVHVVGKIAIALGQRRVLGFYACGVIYVIFSVVCVDGISGPDVVFFYARLVLGRGIYVTII
jgi:hypothetical protein